MGLLGATAMATASSASFLLARIVWVSVELVSRTDGLGGVATNVGTPLNSRIAVLAQDNAFRGSDPSRGRKHLQVKPIALILGQTEWMRLSLCLLSRAESRNFPLDLA